MRRHQAAAESRNDATLNAGSPMPSFAVLGPPILRGDGLYKLTRTAAGVRAEQALPNGLTVVKEFVPTTNYLMAVTLRLENPTANAVDLPELSFRGRNRHADERGRSPAKRSACCRKTA